MVDGGNWGDGSSVESTREREREKRERKSAAGNAKYKMNPHHVEPVRKAHGDVVSEGNVGVGRETLVVGGKVKFLNERRDDRRHREERE